MQVDKSSSGYFPQLETGVTVSEMQLYESRLLNFTADTFRGIHDHEILEFAGIDLLSELEGKVVGDMGSGCGGLAKTAFVEGLDSTIYSINPSLAREEFKMAEEASSYEELTGRYPEISADDIGLAQNYHDKYLVTEFAHKLSFPDNFFDVLIDTTAVHAYTGLDQKHIYPLILKEMLRVLKPGGKILIEDGYRSSIGQKDYQGNPEFKEELLQRIGIRYEIINSERGIPCGAIIYKDN